MGDRRDDFENRLLPNQLVQMAARAAENRDVAQARELCAQMLAQDPHHEDALLWQSVVTESTSDKIRLLQQVLTFNPQNSRARTLLNWAQTRQARGEPASVAVEIECLTPCPHLGTVGDAQVRFTYPCPGNVCHAEATKRRPPREIAEDTQKEVCLTTAHFACPTYCRIQAMSRRSGTSLSGLRDYFDFFGLDEEPFTIVPIPRFLYRARQHERALQALRQVIEHHQGLAVLYGDVGIGKTLVLRTLYEELFGDTRYSVAFLPHPKFGTEYALMRAILQALRVTPLKKHSLRDLESAFESYLIQQVMQVHKTVVLIFDEAQEMGYKLLQQIRRLLDFHVNEQQMVQVVLAGPMSLAGKIAHLPALRDRIVAQYILSPLAPSEVKAFIATRLHEAGSENGFFSPSAVRAITDLTQGHPRRINVLCMRCLWEAFEERRHTIDHDLVMRVADGKDSKTLEPQEAAEPATGSKGILAHLRFLWQRGG